MFEEDDEHECFAESPPSVAHAGVDAVVELVVDLLECASLDVLADLLPVVTVESLLLDDHVFLLVCVGALGCAYSVELQPGLVELDTRLIACAAHGELDKINLVGFAREISEDDFLLATCRLVLVELLHELEVLLVGVLDGLLQFEHARLLLEGVGRVTFELEVAEDAGGRRVLSAQLVCADELLEVV